MNNKRTISQIKNMFEKGEVSSEQIEEFKKDDRKGVQNLLKAHERKLEKKIELEKKYEKMCEYEKRARKLGNLYIAGVDEAGRGPLAGPVVAAAVILPENFKLLGLNDSKQLNEETRDKYFDIIKEEAISYGISFVDNEKIDEINILEATKLAMHQAIHQLSIIPDHVLIDAVRLDKLPCTSESIVKGDANSVSIAAASILAKVSRDRYMKNLHIDYPAYDFATNMGYGTASHLQKLRELGPSPYHRKSFGPVREVVHSEGGTLLEHK